jgi:hypothetical protein
MILMVSRKSYSAEVRCVRILFLSGRGVGSLDVSFEQPKYP